MGKIIAFANQKGGVGKTTSTVNLGASLVTFDKKVLIVDVDPQANATSGLGLDVNSLKGTSVYECLVDGVDAKSVIKHTSMENLDILPSHINLVGAEIQLLNFENRESVMKGILDPLRDEYDYILVDCSPSLGIITLNALTCADSVLIPVQAEYYALEGIAKLMNTIKIVKTKLNASLDIEGFLITMYDARARLSRQVVEEINRLFPTHTYQTIISRNVKLAEAPSYGKNIIEFDIDSPGAKNYRQFAQEFLSRESLRKA
ncbi:MAG: AAA family ATPase [Paludibacteraceae bacterium]|nr:AAA family ATPase [Paludibacteraceae bacterium]